MTVEDMANGEFSSALQLCRMVTQWANGQSFVTHLILKLNLISYGDGKYF